MRASVRVIRHGGRLAALAILLAACFVTPPPLAETTGETTDGSCTPGERGCACYGNGTCEEGLVCNPDVQLCIGPDDETGSSVGPQDSTSASTADVTGTDATNSTDDTSGGSSTAAPDSSSGHEADVSSSDSSGGGICTEFTCAGCVDCVDGESCSREFAACDAVNGCATAVACLVECGLGIDCLDPCCNDLTPQQLEVINALISCKSDECVDPCSGGQGEFDGCA